MGTRVLQTADVLPCSLDEILERDSNGVVAQLGEQVPCKDKVVGSNPIFSTNRNFPLKAMMNRVQLPAIERLVRCVIVSKNRGLRQFGRRLRLGRRGCGFESRISDHFEGLTRISQFKLPPTCKTCDESPVNVWYVA